MPIQTIDLRDAVQAEHEKSREKVRSAFEECLTWLEGPAQPLALHVVERELLTRLMAMGVALLQLWVVLRLPAVVPVRVRHGRGWYRYRDMAQGVVRTRFGEFAYPRAVYESISGFAPALVSPQDRVIGLANGRMTLGVHLLAAYLSAKLVFDEVCDVASQFGGYMPSKRSLLGIADDLGPHASAYIADMPTPADDGEILVIQVDEKGAPMIGSAEHERRLRPHEKRPPGTPSRGRRRKHRRDNPRARRRKGDRSKNARMATVAVVYTLRRMPDGSLEGPINKRVIATFRGRRVLFEMARREAVRRGYGTKPTYFLADGARGLWTMQKRYFPKATPCVDWYHVCEYLWAAGTAVHREGSDELAEWVHDRKDELLRGDIDAVLTALRGFQKQVGRSGPGTKGRRERLKAALRYLTYHRERLRYAELTKADLDIATGAVEGAVNHVVGRRLDGSMMRWSPKRADHVLALRCVAVNGDWESFAGTVAEAHARRRDPTIPRITPDRPQQPYDAVRKVA